MKILVTAATTFEIQPFMDHLAGKNYRNCQVTTLIGGIGMMHTAYQLGRQFASSRPDFAIQAGIAGCFDHSWDMGKVVIIDKEQLGDLGVEDDQAYKDLFDIQLWQPDQAPFTNRQLINPLQNVPHLPELPTASGVTINTVSGSERTRQLLLDKYKPEVESMEGAAFHYACLLEKIPFMQLRSISNYVEVRDKSKWKIQLAIKELNDTLIKYFERWN
ncbi:futalosine hydrolase [Chitinophaga ginsengisoli]|uniref:Futalosine hydrolase n=1 Tax=Chitinophaga ginsengisoli TaxID=363837 RepID=A0A2P8GGM9_9BACT|nr:futalosine hydrolase [Chitinophaga ginsengisoli]PSL33122.1 futalosine hydrolase [Chitinophaga ginsengisoli]